MQKVLIFSAPSGSGKTTVVRHLLAVFKELAFSVSATTRKKRENETDGKDYYFLSAKAFESKIANGEFLEYEEVYAGIYYGTLRSEIKRIWGNNQAVVFDVDVVGGLNLKAHFGEKALAVFVKPPDLETLEERLKLRHTETPESLKTRLAKARFEMGFEERFDITLVNHHLETTFAEAEALTRSFLKSK